VKKAPARPVDSVGRYRLLLPETEIPQLEACLASPTPTAVRINPLKTETNFTINNLRERYGWETQPIKYCPDGFTLTSSRIPPGRILETRLGYLYIQDAASMLPVELFEIPANPAPLILDLTASPGGKSTHLSARFHDRGILIANDGTASRIPALSSTLKNWGAVCSATTNLPGEKYGQWFPETFDIVLLDAPCSMENLHQGGRNKRVIKLAERGRLALRQAQLLMSALLSCKIGGQVVYSTCTLAPEEDEGVLDTVLRKCGSAVKITDAATRLEIFAPGLGEAFGHTYLPETTRSIRLWPHRMGTSGFFAAHLRKTAPIPDKLEIQPYPRMRKQLTALTNGEAKNLTDRLQEDYGIGLEQILEEQDLIFSGYKDSVFAFPRLLDTMFPELPLRSAGLRLGDYSGDGFEISLEWATRYGDQIKQNILELTGEDVVKWSRGEDLPLVPGNYADKGIIKVIKDPVGLVLGTGRVSDRGLKNLLPRHLALKY
jgi:16S rRNA (cytosine1407-C5)-methyltransferase